MRVLGVELPVVTAEDLLVFKLIAGRPQDLADAAALLDPPKEMFAGPNVLEVHEVLTSTDDRPR